MRKNLPVTNIEYTLTDAVLIVTKTDLKGIITYVNSEFIEASGFTELELLGQPHNMVRHPDMPAWAFNDLWKTVKQGYPWQGIVKNRRKNGDYYWVRANVSPITENGQITGYLSVRNKPTSAEVRFAEGLYKSGVTPGSGISLTRRFKNLSLQTKLQVLIQGIIFILMSAITIFIAQHTKELIVDGVQQRAQGIANEVIDSANMLMETGQISDIENRKLLIRKISDSGHIVGLKLVRADQVVKQFGPGLPEEHVSGDLEINAIKSKQAYYGIEERDKGQIFRAVTPYIVSHNFHGTDCLNCHQVEVGSVNGASDVEIDISEDMARYKSMLIALIGGQLVLQFILYLFVRLVVRKYVTRPVEDVRSHLRDLSSAKMTPHIDISGRDEMGKVLCEVQSSQILLGSMINESRQLANSMERIKVALDNVSTGVMIADTNRTIIYANKSLMQLIKKAESDIRKQLPNFNTDNLLGSNIDLFHKNPTHQAELLSSFNSAYKAQIEIGGRHFTVVANPVIDSAGGRLGSVAEWADITAEIAVENEVENIVNAAANGDFTGRINIADKEGFFKQLSSGMNKLMETSAIGLSEVVRVLSALAKGDLTEKITNEYHGTFGQLKDDSNSTVEQLTRVITRIKEATDTINTAAKEIAAGNLDLSQRTEEQASSLEETAASMEELNSTVKHNAENAKEANLLANSASAIAQKGGVVVKEVVTTMSSINESSRKIVDIISVIDGIAFQTNILALNAAVEAARAGEQGRGFAVVASEVRNLAQRSASAAKEIKQLIGDSVNKVEAGSKLVADAGKTMDEIVNAVKHVTDIMAEISAASLEQSQGIEQVNKAITQMDEVTQQNAALVEEAAAAAESLEEEAQSLAHSVSVFKLSQGQQNLSISSPATRLLAKPQAETEDKFSFDEAIEAHKKWKSRLLKYIKDPNSEHFDLAKISLDDQCQLGCWIHGEASAYKKLPEYNQLKADHAKFHLSVGEIVQSILDKNEEEARKKLGGEFFSYSNKTIAAIKTLQHKLSQ